MQNTSPKPDPLDYASLQSPRRQWTKCQWVLGIAGGGLIVFGLLLWSMRIDVFRWLGHLEMFAYMLGGPLLVLIGVLTVFRAWSASGRRI
jgi:hypothetical protein